MENKMNIYKHVEKLGFGEIRLFDKEGFEVIWHPDGMVINSFDYTYQSPENELGNAFWYCCLYNAAYRLGHLWKPRKTSFKIMALEAMYEDWGGDMDYYDYLYWAKEKAKENKDWNKRRMEVKKNTYVLMHYAMKQLGIKENIRWCVRNIYGNSGIVLSAKFLEAMGVTGLEQWTEIKYE